MEKKPFVQMKTGIWINREKLRNALFTLGYFYGLLITLFGVFRIYEKDIIVGIIQLTVALPLWLIVYSHYKFGKQEEKYGREE